MASVRPHTKDYPPEARRSLGLAVTRARELDGHKWRPSFANLAGIAVRSLVKLEKGDPVGPVVYEAVARALPNWTEDTPREILDGGKPPAAGSQESVKHNEPIDNRDPDLIPQEEIEESLMIMRAALKRLYPPAEVDRRIAREREEITEAQKARARRQRQTG